MKSHRFPRTSVGGISVSRMIIGTNWFLGYTHCSGGKNRAMERLVTHRKAIADIIEVFLKAGVDTIMCPHTETCMFDAIHDAQQRTGVKPVIISTPSFSTSADAVGRLRPVGGGQDTGLGGGQGRRDLHAAHQHDRPDGR